ncbi:putative reverse transcriptase domain-containing protein [Tanacetum coccineum]
MPSWMRIRSASRHVAESRGGGTGERVGRGGRVRGPRGGNDERVDELNGQGNDHGLRANGGIEGVNGNVEGVNGGNVGNQNDNVVNENVQENVGNVLVNGNRSRIIERYVHGLAPQIRGIVAATEPKTIQKAIQISGALTDEAIRNGSIKKVKKKGNVGEPSKDKNGKDDKKRTRTRNAFATTANPVRRENTGHLAKDYRGVPRNMNPVNARNPTVRACYECGSTDHGHGNQGNQARGRAFMLGAEEARQDSNIVTGLEPSELGFKYEIKIASGHLVEIDKVIKGCKLEIEGHVFDIDLIPFGHGSFDVIIGMDWLSNHKDEIICHEKVVRKPLLDGKVLRVLGEKPKEKIRQLKSAKTKEKEQEKIVVVRDFPEVFPDDLYGLPPVWEIGF